MEITLYTSNCPKCKILKAKLDDKKINYNICDDTNVMTEKGITSLPALEIDGEMKTFRFAVDWVNEQE